MSFEQKVCKSGPELVFPQPGINPGMTTFAEFVIFAGLSLLGPVLEGLRPRRPMFWKSKNDHFCSRITTFAHFVTFAQNDGFVTLSLLLRMPALTPALVYNARLNACPGVQCPLYQRSWSRMPALSTFLVKNARFNAGQAIMPALTLVRR